ncbi:radical SAM additional 4Fe4S-binding SPASM domain-containing protein [Mariprofundus aestuarium]|uniref:Radical SAM additional 4Fe4S-binding SPASM domain-containing protein n=1 Tax=Mariprofundus aestuarium TaxID=1921086 RepID=A0A2K8KV24_MARES|nr:radical SAM/SPASM domain-containing protein [Mariprofundus aestuarium]ATX78638.1 radical SAM additional 4Fe4S-binding SPASM domain-containing protein [Mariprofundus aestuarium]
MKAKVESKLNLQNRTDLQSVIPLATPYLLYVDPSSACNFQCRFCPTGHKDIINGAGYRRGVLDMQLFRKLLDDLGQFEQPLRVMRMNKIGEPLLNKQLPEMIALAKASGRVNYIDLATNASLFSETLLSELVAAGLDRINISLEGMSAEQYKKTALVDFDFDHLVAMVRWLYAHRGDCEVTVKIPSSCIEEDQKQTFFDTFGDHCDRIFIEDLSPIWPNFDVEEHAGVEFNEEVGQYSQQLKVKDVCSYIFYSAVINSDGTVSACCPDWSQGLVIGDLGTESLKEIWNSEAFYELRKQHLQRKRMENSICSGCGHIKYAQVDDIDPYAEMLLERIEAERGGK